MPWRISASLLRFKRYLILGNIVILAMVVLVALLSADASHKTHEARARQTAANLAQTLSQSLSASFKLADNSLQSMLRRLDDLQAKGVADPLEIARMAEEQRALVPAMDALRVTDADGRVLNPGDRPILSMADRDYFRAARSTPTQTVVSEPQRGRIIGGWGLVIARAHAAPDGRFMGVVYASIKTERFRDSFTHADVGAQGAVTLRSSSLQLIARYSPQDADPEAGIGTAKVSEQLRTALSANAVRGSFVTRTALDGVERVTAYEAVPDYPLVLLVGLATEDFYAAWRHDVGVLAALLLLLEALLVAFSVFIYRAQGRQVRARHEIAQLAGERGALLDNELVAMVRLRDRHEVWHNRALAELFGYAPGELTGQSARAFYPDDEAFERAGKGYARMPAVGRFRAQLQMMRKDGRMLWIDLSGTNLPDGESLWMMVDITAVKEREQQARYLALHDALTGLPNRHLLQDRLSFLLRDAERQKAQLAVCYLDLDGFKAVNDSRGHDAGDALLRAVAQRLGEHLRGNDVVARIGGDEFVVVLSHLHSPQDEVRAVERLLQCFASAFALPDGSQANVGASIGVALYPQHGQEAARLVTLADQAMLAGKRAGKGRWVLAPTA